MIDVVGATDSVNKAASRRGVNVLGTWVLFIILPTLAVIGDRLGAGRH